MRAPLFTIIASLWLVANLAADHSFVDDAPEGFIHVRGIQNKEVADYYIRTDKIVSVEIFTQEIDDKPVPSVKILTVAVDAYAGDDKVRNLSYYLNFAKREEADSCARRIMRLTTETGQVSGEKPGSGSEAKSSGRGMLKLKSEEASSDEKVSSREKLEGIFGLNEPYDPKYLRSLVEEPLSPNRWSGRLTSLILIAATERDESFQDLIRHPVRETDEQIDLAIASYDYMLNQSQAALDKILAHVATEDRGSDVGSIVVLATLDEWDRTIKVFQRHFTVVDGAGASCMRLFLKIRSTSYPQEYAEMRNQFKGSNLKEAYESYLRQKAELDSADQTATAPESDPEGEEKADAKSEGRSQ